MGASSRRVWAAVTLVAALSGGCAKPWDVMTGKRFRKDPFGEPFRSVDPATVIVDPQSLDPDQRAAAMRKLADSKPADEAALLKTLEESATRDPHGICRMAAIDALGKVENPKAEDALLKAYASANKETDSVTDLKAGLALVKYSQSAGSSLAPEQVTQIQIRALDALGKMRSAQGLELILKAAATPDRKPVKSDRFDVPPDAPVLLPSDLRLAALRSLANYKGEPRAVALLIDILKTEQDVAVKGRAHATLKTITGQTIPPDAALWEKWRDSGAAPGAEPGLLEKLGGVFE